MWLSERMIKDNAAQPAEPGTVTVSGDESAVLSGSELRNIRIVSPGGYLWRPRVGDDLLVIKSGTEEKYAVGAEISGTGEGVLPGEVLIFAGDTYLHIKNSGVIEITGDVTVSGRLDAKGGVYSNGVKIG